MRSAVTNVLASAALILSGCVVGLLLGRWGGSVAERDPSDAADGPSEIAPALAKLQASIEDLSRSLHERSVAPANSALSREVVSPIAGRSDRMDLLLERLDELLARLGGEPAVPKRAAQNWKGAGFAGLVPLWQRVGVIRAKGEDDWASEAVTELTRAHLGWARDDVFERYGAPFSLNASNGALSLRYVTDKTEDGSMSFVVFDTFDGIVTQVWIDT